MRRRIWITLSWGRLGRWWAHYFSSWNLWKISNCSTCCWISSGWELVGYRWLHWKYSRQIKSVEQYKKLTRMCYTTWYSLYFNRSALVIRGSLLSPGDSIWANIWIESLIVLQCHMSWIIEFMKQLNWLGSFVSRKSKSSCLLYAE